MIDDEDTWHTVLPHGRKMNEKHKVEFRFLSINLMIFLVTEIQKNQIDIKN